MSLFLKDFNGVVRFFPKFFFHLVASFGHCVNRNLMTVNYAWPCLWKVGEKEDLVKMMYLCNIEKKKHVLNGATPLQSHK